jgi:hypothetical protein
VTRVAVLCPVQLFASCAHWTVASQLCGPDEPRFAASLLPHVTPLTHRRRARTRIRTARRDGAYPLPLDDGFASADATCYNLEMFVCRSCESGALKFIVR